MAGHALTICCNRTEIRFLTKHSATGAHTSLVRLQKQYIGYRSDMAVSGGVSLQELQSLHSKENCKEMVHQAKLHQELLKKLKHNLHEDLILYTGLMDRSFKKVST